MIELALLVVLFLRGGLDGLTLVQFAPRKGESGPDE